MAKLKRKLWLLSLLVALALLARGDKGYAQDVWRHDKETIISYDALGYIVRGFDVAYAGIIPDPFTFPLRFYDPIWDVNIDWVATNASGECVIKSNDDVFCTGGIAYLEITWTHSYLPESQGATMIDVSIADHPYPIATGYTLDVFYPTFLVHKGAQEAPVAQVPGRTQWVVGSTRHFETWVKYYDSRVETLFLPLILR